MKTAGKDFNPNGHFVKIQIRHPSLAVRTDTRLRCKQKKNWGNRGGGGGLMMGSGLVVTFSVPALPASLWANAVLLI